MQFIKFVFIMTVIVLLNLVIVQANGEYQIPQITTISDDATKDNPLAIERYTDIAPALGYKKGEIIVGGVNLYKGDFGKTYIEFTDDYYNSFYITEEKDGKKLRTTNLPGIEKSKPGQGIRFGDDGELEKVDVSKKNSGNLAVNGVEFTAPSNSDIKFLKFYQDENSILVSLDGSKFAEPDDHENNFENPHYVSEPTNTKVRYSTEFSEKLSKVAISPGIYFEKGEIMFDPKKITSERAAASEIYSDKF